MKLFIMDFPPADHENSEGLYDPNEDTITLFLDILWEYPSPLRYFMIIETVIHELVHSVIGRLHPKSWKVQYCVDRADKTRNWRKIIDHKRYMKFRKDWLRK